MTVQERKQFFRYNFKFNTFVIEGLDKVGKTTFINSLFPDEEKVSLFDGKVFTIKSKNIVFCKFPFFGGNEPPPSQSDSYEALTYYLRDINYFMKGILSLAPIWDKKLYTSNNTLLLICDRSPLSMLVYNMPTRLSPSESNKFILDYSNMFCEFFEGDNVILYMEKPEGYPHHFRGETDELDRRNFGHHHKLDRRYRKALERMELPRTVVLYSSKLESVNSFADRINIWGKLPFLAETFYDRVMREEDVIQMLDEEGS